MAISLWDLELPTAVLPFSLNLAPYQILLPHFGPILTLEPQGRSSMRSIPIRATQIYFTLSVNLYECTEE